MQKRPIFITLILLNMALFAGSIVFYAREHAALRTRGLDGFLLLWLIFFGIFTLMMPLTIGSRWEQLTPRDIVREYLVRGGMILAGLTGVVFLFLLVLLLIALPARLGRGELILPWLTILVPFAVTLIDLYNRTYARTLRNLGIGFALYSFRIYGMITIVLTAVFVAFAVGPAGAFLQLASGVDLIARGLFHRFISERPLLCTWFNMEGDGCTPLLFTFHLGHLLLLWLVLRYGERAFNAATDHYKMGLDTLSGWLQK